MEEPSSSKNEALEFSSSSLYLDAYQSFASQTRSPEPSAYTLLSSGSPLPPTPQSFPLHKLIPGTRFIVDGFRSAGDFSVCYFLSHFHSDHYTGLGPGWRRGVIYCSDITARLIIDSLGVSSLFVVALPLGRTVRIDCFDVTLVEANHCPGAVQFLFNVYGNDPQSVKKYVHTGDFRYDESMKLDPSLRRFVGADAVFLDTTYCNPRFSFVSQAESIEYIVDIVEKNISKEEGSSDPVLFLISTYVLGKERIMLELSKRLNCAVHVDNRRMKILRASGLVDSKNFTEDPAGSCIHVIGWNLLGETWPYFRPNFAKMNEIMTEKGYSRAIGFVPSGWMHQKKKGEFPVRVKDVLEIHLVPYSEHSSYEELREYVRFLRPKKVIPTVGMDSSKHDNKNSLSVQKHFSDLLDETANKKELLMGFLCGTKDTTQCEEHLLIARNSNCVDDIDQAASSEEEMERNIADLRDFLPSWVSQEQLLYLHNDSKGDIVEAASRFIECETELYKEANACNQPECPVLAEEPKSTEKDESPIEFFKKGNNMLSKTSPNKRSSPINHLSKKKRKAGSTSQQTGHKQATITAFFGKSVSPSHKKASHVESPSELNEFLHIISGALTQDDATALLNKTKWDINAALDLYYSDHADVPCISSSEGPANISPLAIKEIVVEEVNKDYVSLPLEKYSPVEHACWKPGQPAPYLHLARTFSLVEKEKGKTKSISMFTNMFRSLLALSPEDVVAAVYLCTNKIAPDHKNMELNIGGGLVTTALEQTCGVKR